MAIPQQAEFDTQLQTMERALVTDVPKVDQIEIKAVAEEPPKRNWLTEAMALGEKKRGR